MLKKIIITEHDLKYMIRDICEYVFLEGRNTDWKNVIESFKKIGNEYIVEGNKEYKDLESLIGRLFTCFFLSTAGFGEDENTILKKIKCIVDIYKKTNKLDKEIY